MIVFVTSFHAKMYADTGKDLVASWLKHCPDGKLVAYTEGQTAAERVADPRVAVLPLDGDPWLNGWLSDNDHNIPVELGGSSGRDMTVWDRKSSLWARKTAALFRAYEAADEGDLVVWLDADVIFVADLPRGWFERVCRGKDVVYACSASRKRKTGIESGLVVYRKNKEVDAVVRRIRKEYDNMAARWSDLPRHDDGYVLLAVLRDMTTGDFFRNTHRLTSGAVCFDMATSETGTPLAACPFAPYLVHQKGFHAHLGTDGIAPDADVPSKKLARMMGYRRERERLGRILKPSRGAD